MLLLRGAGAALTLLVAGTSPSSSDFSTDANGDLDVEFEIPGVTAAAASGSSVTFYVLDENRTFDPAGVITFP